MNHIETPEEEHILLKFEVTGNSQNKKSNTSMKKTSLLVIIRNYAIVKTKVK